MEAGDNGVYPRTLNGLRFTWKRKELMWMEGYVDKLRGGKKEGQMGRRMAEWIAVRVNMKYGEMRDARVDSEQRVVDGGQ